MKLAQFKTQASKLQRLGLLANERIIDLVALAAASKEAGIAVPGWLLESTNMLDVIGRGDEALADISKLIKNAEAHGIGKNELLAVALDAVEFLPPVYPSKILAIGRNYADHAIEGGSPPPTAPLIFTKLPNSLSAHNAPIVLPAISSQVDYEAELALIIGRHTRRVSEAEALNYVFGYTLINDTSARDLQFGDGQWVRGKGLDSFAPLGPFITTRDDIPNVQALKIEGKLNGEVMQSSNTSKMIFTVAYLVSYISQAITLEPGDVIATGTPEGVGFFRKPPVLLKAGDRFEVVIENLGVLSNPVIEAEK